MFYFTFLKVLWNHTEFQRGGISPYNTADFDNDVNASVSETNIRGDGGGGIHTNSFVFKHTHSIHNKMIVSATGMKEQTVAF